MLLLLAAKVAVEKNGCNGGYGVKGANSTDRVLEKAGKIRIQVTSANDSVRVRVMSVNNRKREPPTPLGSIEWIAISTWNSAWKVHYLPV